ncbi:MAG: helix-turn-helix domain-containing protein [Streptococcus sp.]
MARGRGKASPQDKEALRIISEKIRELLKEQGKKQIELSRITGIPASTLTGYVKGTSLPVPENLEKIAAFFQVAVADIDPRLRNDFVVIDSEIERLYKQLDEGNQENLLSYGKSLLTHQKKDRKLKSNTTLILSMILFATYQNQKQADIVWFDQKIPYDLAFGFIQIPSSLNTKKGLLC